jgi:adenylate kinase family enzyme
MEKILIIGSGGAGKSTLSRQLGNILNLEVIHLDSLYWHPGWVETPQPEWWQIIQESIDRESWIMDGNYSGTMDIRLLAADTIIFLDFSVFVCLWRVIKRRWQYIGKTRPDMSSGCPERLDWEFIKWVWNYPRDRRPAILEKLGQLATDKKVIILRSPSSVKQFLHNISRSEVPTDLQCAKTPNF